MSPPAVGSGAAIGATCVGTGAYVDARLGTDGGTGGAAENKLAAVDDDDDDKLTTGVGVGVGAELNKSEAKPEPVEADANTSPPDVSAVLKAGV